MIPDEYGPIDERKFVRTKPTPAQIEALIKAGWVVVNHHHTDECLQIIIDLKAALTAAAQVDWTPSIEKAVIAFWVERCAQVAESVAGDSISGPADKYEIAAAIRKLKDEK